MLRSLTVLKSGLSGCSLALPFFDSNQIKLTDSQVPMNPFEYVVAPQSIRGWILETFFLFRKSKYRTFVDLFVFNLKIGINIKLFCDKCISTSNLGNFRHNINQIIRTITLYMIFHFKMTYF